MPSPVQRAIGRQKLRKDKSSMVETARLAYASLISLAREDCPTFCELILKDEETGNYIELQDFQLEWHDLLDSNKYVVLWAFPESGKSQQLVIARILWLLGRDPRRRYAILSATQGQSKKIIRTIQSHITENRIVHEVFPGLKRGNLWTDNAIEIERPHGIKDPSVQAYSPEGGTIQGARLDGIAIDDVLTEINTRTRYQREKVEEWIRASAFSRLSDAGWCFFLTNAWHPDDMAHTLEKQGWTSRRYPVLDDKGESVWPERWPMERIERTKTELLGPLEFARQMLCRARDDSQSRFQQDWIDHALENGEGLPMVNSLEDLFERCPELAEEIKLTDSIARLGGMPEGFLTVTGVDLAVSRRESADLTALFTLGVHPDGMRHVLEVAAGRWTGPEIIDRVVSSHERYRSIVVVENNACFPSGSPVLTAQGYVSIEDVQVGDLVWTHAGRWRPVREVTSRKYEGDLLQLSTGGAPHVRCTPNHAFWARRAGRKKGGRQVPDVGCHRPVGDPQWVSVSEFEGVDSYVALAAPRWDVTPPAISVDRYSSTRELTVDDDLARVIGMFVAEGGGGGQSQVQFTFNEGCDNLACAVEAIADRLGATSRRSQPSSGTLRVTVNSIELKRAVTPIGKGHTKALSVEMMGWPLALRLAIVRGWLLGDGDLSANNKSTPWAHDVFRGSSISRTWIGQATAILLEAGFRPTITYQPAHESEIEGRKVYGRESWRLALNAEDTLRLFDFMPPDEVEWWGGTPKPGKRRSGSSIVFDGGAWTKVRKVEHLPYSGEVFNLVVDEDRSYTVDGLVVHNSQDFLLQWVHEKAPGLRVRSFTTGRNKLSPEYGVESLAAELAAGQWIIPCERVTKATHPQVSEFITEMLYYDPGAHTGDRLMAAWIAREAARLYTSRRSRRDRRRSNRGARILGG